MGNTFCEATAADRRGAPWPGAAARRMTGFVAVLALSLAAAGAQAQTLYDEDGIRVESTARFVARGAEVGDTVFALSLVAPGMAEEPRLLESALRLAAETPLLQVQADTCAAAAELGAEAAERRQRRVGWFLGSIFIPVFLPIVGHTSTPRPPVDELADVAREDHVCFFTGYANAASRRRAVSAWIGSGIGVVLMIASAVANEED